MPASFPRMTLCCSKFASTQHSVRSANGTQLLIKPVKNCRMEPVARKPEVT